MVNKAPEHALRLATVLAGFHGEELHERWIERGINLADFYVNEHIRIMESSMADHEITRAETLLHWIQSQGWDRFALSWIYQNGPSEVRTARAAKEAMTTLVSHGYYVKATEPGDREIDGKTYKDVWMEPKN